MSKADDVVRLRHMLDAARKAVEHTRGRGRADLDRDELLTLALARLLEILGEAAKHVSESCRSEHPEIAWRALAGIRDKLIHGYFDVDLDVLWAIVTV